MKISKRRSDNTKSSDERKVNKDERIKRRNRRRFRSTLSSSQQKGAALTVSLLAVIVLASMIATPHKKMKSISSEEIVMQEQEVVAAKSIFIEPTPVEKDYGSCEIRKGKVPDHPIQSTFTASYPGSGAKMTWKLIEAMTGLVTGDDHQLNGHKNIVSIKTHYPSSEGRQIKGADNIPRAMLLIRNPLHSIPSYYNFVYEYQNNLPGHSTKAPLEEWIKWRDNNFDRQLQTWRRHTEYWMSAYDNLHRMVICYEKLIDDDSGPSEAMKIAEFLSRSDGVTTVAPEEVPCVWYGVIKYKAHRRRLSENNMLKSQYAASEQAKNTLDGIANYSPNYQTSNYPQKRASAVGTTQYKTSTVQSGQYAAAEQTKVNIPPQGNTIYSSNYQSPHYPELQSSAGIGGSTQYKSSYSKENSQYASSEKLKTISSQDNTGYSSNYPQKPVQSSAGTYNTADSALSKSAQYAASSEQAKTISGHSSDYKYKEEKSNPSDWTMEKAKSQLRGSKDASSTYSERAQYGGKEQSNDGVKEVSLEIKSSTKSQGGDGQSQEKKDEIQSKRGGPKYIAPYSPEQLKDLIGVLSELLEQYRDDKDLAPILVSYIDEAARRAEGPPEDENTIIIDT